MATMAAHTHVACRTGPQTHRYLSIYGVLLSTDLPWTYMVLSRVHTPSVRFDSLLRVFLLFRSSSVVVYGHCFVTLPLKKRHKMALIGCRSQSKNSRGGDIAPLPPPPTPPPPSSANLLGFRHLPVPLRIQPGVVTQVQRRHSQHRPSSPRTEGRLGVVADWCVPFFH